MDISFKWTSFGPPKLFLLEMNLSNVATSLFWTVDTFFGPVCSKQPLESGHLLKLTIFFHSVEVDMHIHEQKSFFLFVSMLSYIALNLLPSRDMT